MTLLCACVDALVPNWHDWHGRLCRIFPVGSNGAVSIIRENRTNRTNIWGPKLFDTLHVAIKNYGWYGGNFLELPRQVHTQYIRLVRVWRLCRPRPPRA